MKSPWILVDWNTAESVATAEGLIRPLIATSNFSLAVLVIKPGEEVIPHSHHGLPYFEVVLCILEGQLEVIIGTERITASPGNAIMANPDDMGWINRTNEITKALIIHAPPPAWKSAQEFRERLMGRPGTRE